MEKLKTYTIKEVNKIIAEALNTAIHHKLEYVDMETCHLITKQEARISKNDCFEHMGISSNWDEFVEEIVSSIETVNFGQTMNISNKGEVVQGSDMYEILEELMRQTNFKIEDLKDLSKTTFNREFRELMEEMDFKAKDIIIKKGNNNEETLYLSQVESKSPRIAFDIWLENNEDEMEDEYE